MIQQKPIVEIDLWNFYREQITTLKRPRISQNLNKQEYESKYPFSILKLLKKVKWAIMVFKIEYIMDSDT